jgi:SAM-dependent methyltransferase
MSALSGHAERGVGSAPPTRAGLLREAAQRATSHLRRWLGRARSAVGLRRGVKVQGVYYKELSAESLQRALSKKGRGWKEYRVTFPDGGKQVIRASAQRVYDDVMAPLGYDAGQGLLAPLLEIIRPGSRLLLVNAGTGSAAAWLGAAVGGSGAVVALETDEQSVTFAARRYPRRNVAFEHAGLEGLRGETGGAFDGAAVLRPMADIELAAGLAETWRVIAPGGWLLVACTAGTGEHAAGVLRSLPGIDGVGVRADGPASSSPDLVFATRLPAASEDEGPNRGAGRGGADNGHEGLGTSA